MDFILCKGGSCRVENCNRIIDGADQLDVYKRQVMDGPDFPEAFVPLAGSMGQALDELRKREDVRWTYLSPACDFRADGGETGKYLFGGEELFLNAKGESVISYADYASAMIEEAINGSHIRERISVIEA